MDSLQLKKRDQTQSPALQQQDNVAYFKVPYPHRSHRELKAKRPRPLQPVPRRAAPPCHSWMQANTKPPAVPTLKSHYSCAQWRELNQLHTPWDFAYHHTGNHESYWFPAVTEYSNAASWRKASRYQGLGSDRPGYGGDKAPYIRGGGGLEKASPSSRATNLPQSSQDLQHWYPPTDAFKGSSSEHSFKDVSTETSNSPCTSVKETASTYSAETLPSLPSSPGHLPWLLPHFTAGSLIELRDGRLRRVEHLQTEDFLLGSLACPDLRLSSCTVQNITTSAVSSSTSRILILLHEQQSQELLDVHVEFPFFVRGRGWSSCSPQRTARLCGLQCHQLSVGDVYLALTPVSPAKSSAGLQAPAASDGEEGRCGSLQAPHSQSASSVKFPSGHERREGESRNGSSAARRRRYSAPELSTP